eukprot:scaffold250309_cov13-Tisochrysis_lutea.AAC.1
MRASSHTICSLDTTSSNNPCHGCLSNSGTALSRNSCLTRHVSSRWDAVTEDCPKLLATEQQR